MPRPSPEHAQRLGRAVDALVGTCPAGLAHVGRGCLPSKAAVVEILQDLQAVLFPGYFCEEEITHENLEDRLRARCVRLVERLTTEISRALEEGDAETREQEAAQLALQLIEALPALRATLEEDVDAAIQGDPAARSAEEVLLSYPAVRAIATYRVAHLLHGLRVPLIPRMMTEAAHAVTGIDIHPGAHIGPGLFIDHGTGVVIGETAVIGKRCKLYQGVTLGARSVERTGEPGWQPRQRHPTLEDHVTVYAHATILGGRTVVGAGSVIGGNVWLVRSVPPGSTVQIEPPFLLVRHGERGDPAQPQPDFQI